MRVFSTCRNVVERPIGLLRSTCIHFDVVQQGEHNGAETLSLAFLVQKLHVKTCLQENAFLIILTYIA